MAVNTATATSARRGATLIVVLVGGGAAFLAERVCAYGFATDTPQPASIEPAVARLCAALAIFTLVTGVTFALGALYFAKDLDLLHSSPVAPRTIVSVRMTVQLALGMALGSVLAGPPLVAYLATIGRLWALPLVGLVVVSVAAAALALGTAAAIAVVRVVPARRIRDAAGILASLALVLSVGTNLALRGPSGFTDGLPSDQFLSPQPTVLDSPAHPIGWASRALTHLAAGEVALGALWALPLVLLALLLVVAVPRLAERAYVVGWQRGAETSAGRRERAGSLAARRRRRPPVWAVIALKDLRTIRGDGQQLAQLVLPMAMFGVYLANPPALAWGRLPAWYGVGLTACFAAMFACSGLALRGVGMEGRGFWILKSSPIHPAQVLTAKLVTGTGVALVLSTLLFGVGIVRSGADVAGQGLGLLDVLMVTAGLAAIAVGLGACRPRLDWTDPRRSVGMPLSIGYLVLGGAYVSMSFTALAIPYALDGDPFQVLVGQAVVVLVTAGLAWAALAVGCRRLACLEG